jgi:hypothetical protein
MQFSYRFPNQQYQYKKIEESYPQLTVNILIASIQPFLKNSKVFQKENI